MPDKPTYEELEQRVRELKSSESELKRKLDALQQKENRYQNLFEHMLHEVHVWELVFDDQGNIRTWKLADANPATLKSWNKTLPEVIGKTTDEIFPDSNATEQFLPIVKKIYREGVPHRWESYFSDTDQILHMVSVSIGDYFISTGTDITDLKMFEETLKKREKDLRESQKIAHLGSWWLDLTTNQVEWTEELYRMYGFDPSLPPPPYTEHMKLFTPESWERLSTSLARTAETGMPYELELETVKGDGSNGWMWVWGEAVNNAEGQIIGLWGAAQDITDQKRIEADLRNSEERLRTVIDSSPFPVAFANTNNEKILFWSQSALKMFGHKPQKVSEWYELAYPDPDYRNEVIQRWKPFLEKTQQTKTAVNTGEYRIFCQNGAIKICEIYVQYIPGNLIVTFNDITERKQTELALKESEERFRAIFESTSDFVFLKDRNLRYVKVNKAMENLFGKSRKEIIGLTDEELFGGDAAAHIKEVDSRVLRGETIEEEDTKPVDDKFYTFHINKTPVIGENGEIVGLCGIARDITDRKQTEEALKKSEEKYRLIAQNMSDVVSILDMDFRFTYASPSIKRLTGLSPEAFINQSVEEIMPPEYFEEILKTFEEEMMMEASGNAEPFRTRIIEFEQYTQDGSTVWVEVSCSFLRDAEKQPVGILAVSRDISDRKQAEKRLISLERKNRALLDYSPVCHKIVDLDFNLQYMSDSGFKMLKLNDVADVYGKPYPFYFFPEAFRNEMTQKLKKVEKTGKTITMEALTNDIEGNDVWLYSSIIPVLDENGKIDYMTVVSADITERKRDEKEKKRLEGQLQQSQKLESIGTLAGGIAHDFNNILSSLIGFTELALDDAEKGSSIEDSLQEIYAGGKRARDLVKQILAFARQSDDAIKPVQVDIIAKEVLKLLRASIPTTIQIDQNIEKNLTIMGNPTQVHQVIMNICTNSAQAMDDSGGILKVSIKDTMVDKSDGLNDLIPGEYAEIKISDTGAGIDPEILDKIFDPFFTTKEIGKGTGMGLALAHGIIKSYNGLIAVESKPGQGTEFTVYLPLIRSRGESDSYQPEILPTGDERILLVDDETPIAKMTSQILQKLGYEVVFRTSSLKALELFRSEPDDFDLVITDMTMPDMTGDKLAFELMSTRRDIPVILFTGYSSKLSDITAADIGIKAFAYKPVSKSDLATTVRKVLDEAKSTNKG